MPRSESFADLNLDHIGSTPPSRLGRSFGKNLDSDLTAPGKQFGLGKLIMNFYCCCAMFIILFIYFLNTRNILINWFKTKCLWILTRIVMTVSIF